MTVSHQILHRHSRTIAAGATDVSARATSWPRYRPIAIALPILMVTSYFTWRVESPPSLGHISLRTWLLLCLAGAAMPVVTFGLALRLSDRRPLVGPLSRDNAGIHLLAILAAFALDQIARAIVIPRSPIPVHPYPIAGLFANAAGTYIVFALGCQGFRTIRDAKRAEAARVKLRADLAEASQRRAEAELRALKAELNPHFLGNALQGVKALMRTDVDAAQRLLSPLADLLRTSLTRASTHETTLREEIEALRPFIDVERARLRGRLDVQLEIELSTYDLLVPDMILQPLVENAVKHGLIPFGGGRILIAARRVRMGDYVELVVEDDGVALGSVGTTRSSKRGGVGLANIRARLTELYAGHATLELTRGGIGTLVRVTLPSRDAGTAEPLEPEIDERASAIADGKDSTAQIGFLDDTWAGRGVRVFKMAATIGLWFLWTMNNVIGNTRNALAKGYDDKRMYSIVDGVLVGTMMVGMVLLAFWLARRMPLTDQRARSARGAGRVAIVTVGAGIAYASLLCLAKIGVAFAYRYTVILEASHLKHNFQASVITLNVVFLITWAFAQGYYAMLSSHSAKKVRRTLSNQLHTTHQRRADAELRALKSELNPHFIGNALNAVSVLMRTDIAAASCVIDQLSDLLRAAVDRAGTQEVTLREELETLQPFLAVERIRLGHDLAVNMIVDARTLDGLVPHMILQPLVENAVKHGFALRTGGCIEVHARRDERRLELSIRDDGAGLSTASASAARRGGTGLANARARLPKLYGESASLELSSGPGGGAVARLLIPWHERDGVIPRPTSTEGNGAR